MGREQAFYSPVTKAYVHSYEPLRLYIYDHRSYPYDTLNVLVKALVFEDARYREGRYLFTQAEEPEAADLFIFPCDLNYFEGRENEVYDLLEFFSGNERRHVFFDHRDQTDPFPSDISIRLKVSLHRWQVSNTLICIPYLEMVDNFFWYLRRPREIKYELSFLGEWTPLREQMVSALGGTIEPVYFRLREKFFHTGYLQFSDGKPVVKEGSAGKRALREEFIEVSLQSKFVLALRGYGLNSFRFFESLSLGVPPILVSDDCALPYAHLIDYEKFCIRVEAHDDDAVGRIREAVYCTRDETYAEMCRAGRLHFDTFFSAKNFLYLLYDALYMAI
jgi:hypothetical protein